MTDSREYSFGDWSRLFLRAAPALLLAALLVALPVAVAAGLVWLLVPIGPR